MSGSKRTLDEAFEGHLQHAAFVCTRASSVQPWERGLLKDTPLLPTAFPSKGRLGNAVSYAGIGTNAGSIGSAQSAASSQPVRAGGALAAAGVSLPTKKGAAWDVLLDEARSAALAKWERIVTCHGSCFGVYRRWQADQVAGSTKTLAEVLADCFAGRATATLHGRAGPVLRYVKGAIKRGESPFPIAETKVYAFISEITVAPTFPKSFLGSLAFVRYVLELDVSDGDFSARVTGAAKRRFLTKRVLQQKPPLTVQMVKALERLVLGHVPGATVVDRIAAGFFAFTLYSRARFSDAQACGGIFLDVVTAPDGSSKGYIEAGVARSKTSFLLERKTQYLNIVCPILGLDKDP